MGDSNSSVKPKLLTRAVKTVGILLGPSTPTGRAFGVVEKNLTLIIDKIGQSDPYLDHVGRRLSKKFQSRVRRNSLQENVLHALRLPTSTEVAKLRHDVRSLHDQMEALTTQLEVVLESLEKKNASSTPKPEESP
ncbi:MAG TPA: hypothetical protein PKA58_07715 [Polyangium sp.]|jgi:uncharacterized coiled-coil protein SlyX|nr:hypothetical protein [Polyangium sp.]